MKKEIRLPDLDVVSRITRYAILFVVLSFLIAILQLGFVYIIYSNDMELTFIEKIAVYATLGFSGLFIITQLLEFARYNKLAKEVTKEGRAVDKNALYAFAGNNTLGRAVRFMQNVLLTITLVFCFGFITYSIFDYMYIHIIILLIIYIVCSILLFVVWKKNWKNWQ